MRFDDEQYLKDWVEHGVFPKIHDDIFTLVGMTYESDAVIDMCCSIGILGQRLKEKLGLTVIAVEMKQASIDKAKKWGIELPYYQMKIVEETIDDFVKVITGNYVTGIVARRCISELFGNRGYVEREFADKWTNAIADAGVREVWLEGRADQGRSVHPIPDTDTEISCLSARYRVSERYKECAYLTLIDD